MRRSYPTYNMLLRNAVERTYGVFKNMFQYFNSLRANFVIEMQVPVVYYYMAVQNFINLNHPTDLNVLPIEPVYPDPIDARQAQEESEHSMEDRRDVMARWSRMTMSKRSGLGVGS
jgi:hypothetical protein